MARKLCAAAFLGEEVHAGNLQRDREELSRSYAIDCDESEKPYKWFWSASETLPIPAVGRSTAPPLHLAEQFLKPLLPASSIDRLKPNFVAARHMLNERSRVRARRWLNKIHIVPRTLRVQSARIAPGIYDIVTEVLYEDRQVKVRYLAASSKTGEAKTYAIHPYTRLHRDVTTELIGRIDGDGRIRRWDAAPHAPGGDTTGSGHNAPEP